MSPLFNAAGTSGKVSHTFAAAKVQQKLHIRKFLSEKS